VKLTKNNKIVNEIIVASTFVMLIVSISFLIYMTNIFYSGLHNVDLSYNVAINSELNGQEFFDKGLDLETRPIKDYYVIGLAQMRISFLGFGMFSFIVGYFIGLIFMTKNGKGE
jgi:hypothetical protein